LRPRTVTRLAMIRVHIEGVLSKKVQNHCLWLDRKCVSWQLGLLKLRSNGAQISETLKRLRIIRATSVSPHVSDYIITLGVRLIEISLSCAMSMKKLLIRNDLLLIRPGTVSNRRCWLVQQSLERGRKHKAENVSEVWTLLIPRFRNSLSSVKAPIRAIKVLHDWA